MTRPPPITEAELREQGLTHSRRRHSHELIQQLTFFIIASELVGCGYLLVNAKELAGIPSAKFLYLVCGMAALFGILWRVLCNESYYRTSHGLSGGAYPLASRLLYWPYFALSIVAFVWAIYAGTRYLHELSATGSRSAAPAVESEPAPLPAPGQVRG